MTNVSVLFEIIDNNNINNSCRAQPRHGAKIPIASARLQAPVRAGDRGESRFELFFFRSLFGFFFRSVRRRNAPAAV